MWKCFIITEEDANLVKKVEKDLANVEQELGDKPKVANKIIIVLNSKKKEELNQIGIKDRTSKIMDFEKFLTKRNLIQQVQSKLVHLQKNVQWYTNHYKKMVEMGLPEYNGKKANFLSLPNYQQLLTSARGNVNKFKGVTRILKSQTIFDLLDDDFFLLWRLRNLFQTNPMYEACTKSEKDYRRMISWKYPLNQESEPFAQPQ
jgi:hypothetical protein